MCNIQSRQYGILDGYGDGPQIERPWRIRYEISRYSKFAIQAQRDDPITPKRPPLAEGGELEIPLPQHHVAVEGRGSSGGGQTG